MGSGCYGWGRRKHSGSNRWKCHWLGPGTRLVEHLIVFKISMTVFLKVLPRTLLMCAAFCAISVLGKLFISVAKSDPTTANELFLMMIFPLRNYTWLEIGVFFISMSMVTNLIISSGLFRKPYE